MATPAFTNMSAYQPTLVQPFHEHMCLHNRGIASKLATLIARRLDREDCDCVITEMRIMSEVLSDWLSNIIDNDQRHCFDIYVQGRHRVQADQVLKFIKPHDTALYANYWLDDVLRHYVPFAAYMHEIH